MIAFQAKTSQGVAATPWPEKQPVLDAPAASAAKGANMALQQQTASAAKGADMALQQQTASVAAPTSTHVTDQASATDRKTATHQHQQPQLHQQEHQTPSKLPNKKKKKKAKVAEEFAVVEKTKKEKKEEKKEKESPGEGSKVAAKVCSLPPKASDLIVADVPKNAARAASNIETPPPAPSLRTTPTKSDADAHAGGTESQDASDSTPILAIAGVGGVIALLLVVYMRSK